MESSISNQSNSVEFSFRNEIKNFQQYNVFYLVKNQTKNTSIIISEATQIFQHKWNDSKWLNWIRSQIENEVTKRGKLSEMFLHWNRSHFPFQINDNNKRSTLIIEIIRDNVLHILQPVHTFWTSQSTA